MPSTTPARVKEARGGGNGSPPWAPGSSPHYDKERRERLVRVEADRPAWNAVAADMARHPSQFDAAWLAAVSHVPAADRTVYVAPAPAILKQPTSTCP